jgi:hypothetical protein
VARTGRSFTGTSLPAASSASSAATTARYGLAVKFTGLCTAVIHCRSQFVVVISADQFSLHCSQAILPSL